jgi:hypothetical protein
MPQCKKSSSATRLLNYLMASWLIAGDALMSLPAAAAEPAQILDSREIYTSSAPGWLRAVGKLRVPGSTYLDGKKAHLQEDCSATLVTGKAGREADTIVTAWHCLVNYSDLSRPIVFALLPEHEGGLQREAYRLTDGGGMHADWAILRLTLPIAPGDANALLINPGPANPVKTISMAGYSRDSGRGDHGKRLTFDPACVITAVGPATSDSNCLAHKGASGGAVVQLSGNGIPLFSGVISEGDSAGLSTFVPVGIFRGAIGHHLR